MPSHYTPERAELDPGLYLVATPIGNLEDITLRALNVLASVDLIACEDTRVSKRLLSHYGIHTHLEAYHEHNAARMRPKLLGRLQKNERIALISDAGTPLISDPGYKLVREAIEQNIRVIPVPGASSVMAALCGAGLPTDKFLYLGFLPSGEKDVEKLLTHCEALPSSLILFSTPNKLKGHLEVCLKQLGNREITLCRELTKLYEQFWRGNISTLIEALECEIELRGEMVLVIAPSTNHEIDAEALDAAILEHLERLPLKSAANEVSALLNIPKNKVYQRALELRRT